MRWKGSDQSICFSMRKPTARESMTSPVKSNVYSRRSGALGAAAVSKEEVCGGAGTCGAVRGLNTHQPPAAIAARRPQRSHCFLTFIRTPLTSDVAPHHARVDHGQGGHATTPI